MSSDSTSGKKVRLSLVINSDLSEKIKKISMENNLSASEIARQALQSFVDQKEKENLEKELEAGYKSNYDYYLKSNENWNYTLPLAH